MDGLMRRPVTLLSSIAMLIAAVLCIRAAVTGKVDILQGAAAFSDYRSEKPGVFRKLTVADLPKPFATRSVDNGPHLVSKPPAAVPQALPGFKVTEYATTLTEPRLVRTAPNADLFVAESDSGRVKVLRGIG